MMFKTLFAVGFTCFLLTPFLVFSKTYYVATEGSDWSSGSEEQPWKSVKMAALTARAGDTVYIKAGVYPGPLVPEQSGREGAYIIFSAAPGDERKAIIEGGKGSVGAIDIVRKSFIKIVGLKVQNTPKVGIFAKGPGASHIDIIGNHTLSTGSSGILVMGVHPWRHKSDNPAKHHYRALTHLTIKGNLVEKPCVAGYNEDITVANGVDQFEIIGNKIIDGPLPSTGHGAQGIDIKEGVSNGIIAYNEISNIIRIPIYIEAGRGGDYKPDPWIRNVDVFNNYVHDSGGSGINVSSEGKGGIDGLRVYNNIVTRMNNVGIVLHKQTTGVIKNVSFFNNTTYDNGGEGMHIKHPDAKNITVRNNIAYKNKKGNIGVYSVGSGAIVDHNLDGIDPRFVDPDNGNFRLQPNSPAIDTGSSDNAPNIDFYGNPRPQGKAVDLGAIEHCSRASY